jgi:hypothetical protein
VPPDADKHRLEEYRLRVEHALEEVTREAEGRAVRVRRAA